MTKHLWAGLFFFSSLSWADDVSSKCSEISDQINSTIGRINEIARSMGNPTSFESDPSKMIDRLRGGNPFQTIRDTAEERQQALDNFSKSEEVTELQRRVGRLNQTLEESGHTQGFRDPRVTDLETQRTSLQDLINSQRRTAEDNAASALRGRTELDGPIAKSLEESTKRWDESNCKFASLSPEELQRSIENNRANPRSPQRQGAGNDSFSMQDQRELDDARRELERRRISASTSTQGQGPGTPLPAGPTGSNAYNAPALIQQGAGNHAHLTGSR